MSTDDPQLDARLDTASIALSTALDEVLDLDAGLADARLPSRRAQLTRALDDVLDLDAGLRHIMPTPAAVPQSSPSARSEPAHPSPLTEFALRFAALPVHERLTARTWFPTNYLATARTAEALKIDVQSVGRALEVDLDRDFTFVHDLVRDLRHAHARAHDLRHAHDAIDLDLDLDVALAHARDVALALARAHDIALTLAHALDRDLPLPLVHDLTLVFTRDLARARDLDREGGLARGRDHALARARDHALDHALVFARDLARDLAHAIDLALRGVGHEGFDRWLISAIDQLDAALSNMVACDLTGVDLHGIPLVGVRWSPTTTRWPAEWAEHIRHNSIQIDIDLYEIQPGTTPTNITTAV